MIRTLQSLFIIVLFLVPIALFGQVKIVSEAIAPNDLVTDDNDSGKENNTEITQEANPAKRLSIQKFDIPVYKNGEGFYDSRESIECWTTLRYYENDGAVAIEPDITLSDIDGSNIVSAKVYFYRNFKVGEDSIVFEDQNGISGSYNSSTGKLKLTGDASKSDYQKALSEVAYYNSSEDPNTDERKIIFSVNNGSCDNIATKRYVKVIPINDPPVISGTPWPLQYNNGDGSVIVDSAISIIDVDNTHLLGATVRVQNNFNASEDMLSVMNQFGVSASFDEVTATLKLTGSAKINEYERILSDVRYTNANLIPDTSTRGIAFRVFDCEDSSNIFLRNIEFTAANMPPGIVDDSGNPLDTLYLTTDEDTPIDVCIITIDQDGDFTAITNGNSDTGNGSLEIDSLCFKYTPNQDFNGIDTLTITVCDDALFPECDNLTIIIDIIPVNDPPQVVDLGTPVDTLYFTTDEDIPIGICLDVFDLENDPTEISTITSFTTVGTYEDDSTALCFTFIPNYNYFGQEISEVVVCEIAAEGLCDTVILVIDILPVNDPPEIVDNQDVPADTLFINVPKDTASEICVKAIDPEGDATNVTDIISLTGLGSLDNGSLEDMCFTFIPENDFTGLDTLEVKVCDMGEPSECDSAILIINVFEVETRKIFQDSNNARLDTLFLETNEDTPLDFCMNVVEEVDEDINISLIDPVNDNSANGTMVTSDLGEFCLTYTPEENFFGQSSWIVKVCTNEEPILCDSLVIIIDVIPVNDPPIAIDDTVFTNRNIVVEGNVLDNDWDIENDILSVKTQPEINPVRGSVQLYTNGNFEYRPDPGFTGNDTFTYIVFDDGDPNLSDTAEVHIIVDEVALIVYQAVSPNGDDRNDYLHIEGIESYPDNILSIYDRFNNHIFEISGYDNNHTIWRGQANKGMSGNEMPEGTYFYILNPGDGSDILKGFIVLKLN